MIGSIFKSTAFILVGGIGAMVAITWTDDTLNESYMEQLRKRHEDQLRKNEDCPMEEHKADLKSYSECLLSEAEKTMLLTSSVRDLRNEMNKFISNV